MTNHSPKDQSWAETVRPMSVHIDTLRLARELAGKFDEIIPEKDRPRIVAMFYESLMEDYQNLKRLNEESYGKGNAL